MLILLRILLDSLSLPFTFHVFPSPPSSLFFLFFFFYISSFYFSPHSTLSSVAISHKLRAETIIPKFNNS